MKTEVWNEMVIFITLTKTVAWRRLTTAGGDY